MSVKINMKTFTKTDFWFADGNVVLLARDVAFKVHRGPLVRHSDIFRDMFSLPQGAGGAKSTSEDAILPVVHLQDNPHDIKILLGSVVFGESMRYVLRRQVLFFCFFLLRPASRPTPKLNVDEWMSVLKLSTMWCLDDLRTKAVDEANEEVNKLSIKE